MESQADYRLTPPAELPNRYQQEAAALLLGTVADPSQALTDIIAQLLTKHASDCAWLISQIQLWEKDLAKAEARVKAQQAELAEQEVDKLSLLRELRETRAALHNATR